MAKLGEIVLVLKGQAASLVRNLSIADKKLAGTVETLQRYGTTFSTMGRQLAMSSAAVGIALGFATKQAIDFQSQMAFVSTMIEDTDKWMGELEEGVASMSMQFGRSTKEMSTGLYNVLSASIAVEESLEALTVITKSAVAGQADSAIVTRTLTATMNAYGMEVKDLTKLSDIMFMGVKRGQFTYEELAGSIGKAMSTAATAKVPFEELMAAFSLITREGISAAETSTALNAAIMAFFKPSQQAAAVAKELGLELTVATLKERGLFGAMQDLVKATEGMDEQILAQLFPSKRALKALFKMTGNAEKFGEDVQAMYNSTGAAAEAYGKMTDTVGFKMSRLKEQGINLLREFGKPLLEVLLEIIPKLIKFAKRISALSPALKRFLVVGTAVRTLLGIFVGMSLMLAGNLMMLIANLIKLKPLIDVIRIKIVTLKASMMGAVSSTALLTAALYALIVAVAAVKVSQMIDEWKKWKKAIDESEEATKSLAEQTKKIIKDGSEAAKVWREEFGDNTQKVFENTEKAEKLLLAAMKKDWIIKKNDDWAYTQAAIAAAEKRYEERRKLLTQIREHKKKEAEKEGKIEDEAAEETLAMRIKLFKHSVKMGEKDIEAQIKFWEDTLKLYEDGTDEKMKLEERLYGLKKDLKEKEAEEEKARKEKEKEKWEAWVNQTGTWAQEATDAFIEGVRAQREKEGEEKKAMLEANFDARRKDIEDMQITTEEKAALLEKLKEKELAAIEAVDEARWTSVDMVKEGGKKVVQYVVKEVAGIARARVIEATIDAWGKAGLTFGTSLLALAGQIAAITAAEAGLTAILGSFQKGGEVERAGLYRLHKGETVSPSGAMPAPVMSPLTINNNFHDVTIASEFDLDSISNAVSKKIVKQVNKATRWRKY